jgi:hypothetical protein
MTPSSTEAGDSHGERRWICCAELKWVSHASLRARDRSRLAGPSEVRQRECVAPVLLESFWLSMSAVAMLPAGLRASGKF